MSVFRPAFFILVSCLIISFQASPQTNGAWDWVNEHFGKAFNELFPIGQRSGTYVAYRSHRDLHTEVLEYSFVIGYDPVEKGYGLQPYLTAHVRVADSVSVYDQMMALHRGHPGKPIETIKQELRVRRWNLAEKQCPAVKSSFIQFQQLHFTAPHFDTIVLHSLIHEVHVQAGDGDMMMTVSDEENPLIKWALQTRRDLESCASGVR